MMMDTIGRWLWKEGSQKSYYKCNSEAVMTISGKREVQVMRTDVARGTIGKHYRNEGSRQLGTESLMQEAWSRGIGSGSVENNK